MAGARQTAASAPTDAPETKGDGAVEKPKVETDTSVQTPNAAAQARGIATEQGATHGGFFASAAPDAEEVSFDKAFKDGVATQDVYERFTLRGAKTPQYRLVAREGGTFTADRLAALKAVVGK